MLYEHRPDDLRAVGLVADLRGLFEAKDPQGQVTAPADSDLGPVLFALEAALEASQKANAGPSAFIETATRVAADLGVRPAPPRPTLILEP